MAEGNWYATVHSVERVKRNYKEIPLIFIDTKLKQQRRKHLFALSPFVYKRG